MKKINIILSGAAGDSYTFLYLKLNGSDDSSKKATIFGFDKNLVSHEDDGTDIDIFGFNELLSSSYLRQDTKHRVVSAIAGSTGSLLRSHVVTAISKNGQSLSIPLDIIVTPLNLIKATSIGTNDKDTGNTLVYLPGVDSLNSKDFNVYEVALTPQALFTFLNT